MVKIKRGIILIVSLLFIILITTFAEAAIWTTDGVAQQKNEFSCGEVVGLSGNKLTASTTLNYEIKNKTSGGDVVASGTVDTDANGDIVFQIIWTIPEFYSNNRQHKVYVYDTQTKKKTFFVECDCEDDDEDSYYGYDSDDCPAGTDCDDGNTSINPGVSEVCNGVDDNCVDGVDEGGNLLCDDGLYCDGEEYCDGINGCQAGITPDCDDGMACSDDSCDEINDQCVNTANDANCDDGLFCNGLEYCDTVLDCQLGTSVNCSDDYTCTDDSCVEDGNNTGHCENIVNDPYCGEGEICDPKFDPPTGCGICAPNWVPINTSCRLDDTLIEWYNDTNSCFERTNFSSYNFAPQNNTYYCDYDDNGIISDISKINTTLQNMSISIGNFTNLSKTFTGTETVEFKEGNETLVVFDFNFSQHKLNLANLTIDTQSENATKGSLIISGLRLAKGGTKTVYIDDLDESVDKVCIKDAEIVIIDEISASCDGENEFLINCDSVVSNGYNCTDLGDKYKITGLNHSGVVEYTPFCGDGSCDEVVGESCSSCAQDCGDCPAPVTPAGGGGGGGVGGGGGGVAEWVCEDWSPCEDGKSTLFCYRPYNRNIYYTKTKDCQIPKPPAFVPEEEGEGEKEILREEEEQMFPEELGEIVTTGNFLTGFLSMITGGIVAGLERLNKLVEIDLIVIVVLLCLFAYYFQKRGKYKVFK